MRTTLMLIATLPILGAATVWPDVQASEAGTPEPVCTPMSSLRACEYGVTMVADICRAPAEGVRLPTHPHRSHTVLRDTQLPVHRRQTRPELL